MCYHNAKNKIYDSNFFPVSIILKKKKNKQREAKKRKRERKKQENTILDIDLRKHESDSTQSRCLTKSLDNRKYSRIIVSSDLTSARTIYIYIYVMYPM